MKNKFLLFFLSLFLSACSNSDSLSGYIEGEYTYVASTKSGTLQNLNVKRGQKVEKNTLLFALDPEPEKSQVTETQADIEALKAQVDFYNVQLQRQQSLYQKHAAAKADLDEAQSQYDSASDKWKAQKAQLIQNSWALSQKTVYAPVDGFVFDTFYRLGENVIENQPVLALLSPDNIKVLFYIPEEKLSRVHLNQTITFGCDGCQHKNEAKISYISPQAEYTPPVIYSKDSRSKLVYLVRAALPRATAEKFHPGQPIDVYL